MMRKRIKAAQKAKPSSSLGASRFTLPTFDSIAQCSASTGIPVSVLKFSKKNGCPAFDYSRVKLGTFLEWFFSKSESGKNWDDSYKEYRAKREQQKFNREEGLTIRTADAEKAGAIVFGMLSRVFRSKFANDMPASIAGKPEPAIRDLLLRAVDDSFAAAILKHKETLQEAKKLNEDDELAG